MLIVTHLVKKFSAFYGISRLSIAFTRTATGPNYPVHASPRPIHIHFPLSRSSQRIRPRARSCVTFRNQLILFTPLVGCPRVLIQYFRSYTPYLEAVSSIRSPNDAPCLGDRDPHEQWCICVSKGKGKVFPVLFN